MAVDPAPQEALERDADTPTLSEMRELVAGPGIPEGTCAYCGATVAALRDQLARVAELRDNCRRAGNATGDDEHPMGFKYRAACIEVADLLDGILSRTDENHGR